MPTVGTTTTGFVAAAGWADAEFVSDCRTCGQTRRVTAVALARPRGAPGLTTVIGSDDDESPRRDVPRAALPA
ncbi:MAG: hypothetical protein WCJ98_07760 [Mycobacteriaceae bacterium]